MRSSIRARFDKLGCFLFDSIFYGAPVQPYKLIYISPIEIKHSPCKTPSTSLIRPSPVLNGDWDLQLREFREDVVYKSFKYHFEHDISWDKTEYYQFMLDRISEHGSYKSMTAKAELQTRCDQLDQLYNTIKENGYKTQRELGSEKINSIDTEPSLPPERKEITVHISRDGEFLWSGGAHRLAITKLVGIDKIPVRINIRHQQWQEIRDRVYKGEPVDDELKDHPDLQFDS